MCWGRACTAGSAGALGAFLFLLALGPAGTARAEPDGWEPVVKEEVRWREVWAGVDATADGWLAFTGMTTAPFSGIHDQGLRIRSGSGYGTYRYSGNRNSVRTDVVLGRAALSPELMKFDARTGFSDVLVGYLWRFDPLIVKLFAGASGIGHEIAPLDDENLASGLDWGAKGVMELWLNMGQGMWGSFDASWSQAHDTRSARARIGYRLMPALSVGLEGRLDIDAQGACDLHWDESGACRQQYRAENEPAAELLDYSRAGLLVRFEWLGGEVSAAGGISGGSLGRAEFDDPNPYGTVSWIMQY